MIHTIDQIDRTNLPKHVAIIMDGNGRWAKSKGEERTFGHRNAIDAVRSALKACDELNIPFLTLYTFSSENWGRPQKEVSMLMNLLAETLLQEANTLVVVEENVFSDVTALDLVFEHEESVANNVKVNKTFIVFF